ncbi:hypothetical protein DB824_19780 [Xanthomonas perforans]|nr:hypothetical protein DB834_22760 [Xanthomonas perforans]TQV01038.1 hypothetical protein DB821_09195 [Xanthomonas perforans]TQV05083.1 hypothetical protein DB824_19780 [Xanthomonas perforans]
MRSLWLRLEVWNWAARERRFLFVCSPLAQLVCVQPSCPASIRRCLLDAAGEGTLPTRPCDHAIYA